MRKKMLLMIMLLCALPLQAATLKGTDGSLPGYWRIVVENKYGDIEVICNTPPFVLFASHTIACAEGTGSSNARVDGDGRLFGWRVANGAGFDIIEVCQNPIADVGRSLIICRDGKE